MDERRRNVTHLVARGSDFVKSHQPRHEPAPRRHATEVAKTPADWMPWNYRETLALLEATDSKAT